MHDLTNTLSVEWFKQTHSKMLRRAFPEECRLLSGQMKVQEYSVLMPVFLDWDVHQAHTGMTVKCPLNFDHTVFMCLLVVDT